MAHEQSVAQDSSGNTVVRVIIDGQIEEKRVVTGIIGGGQTELISRLSEGEVVVRKGSPSRVVSSRFLGGWSFIGNT